MSAAGSWLDAPAASRRHGALAASLEREAELVDHGTLTLDAEQALDKLGRYQLADPYHYVLRLAEAGVRLGAEALWFWTKSDALVMPQRGASVPRQTTRAGRIVRGLSIAGNASLFALLMAGVALQSEAIVSIVVAIGIMAGPLLPIFGNVYAQNRAQIANAEAQALPSAARRELPAPGRERPHALSTG